MKSYFLVWFKKNCGRYLQLERNWIRINIFLKIMLKDFLNLYFLWTKQHNLKNNFEIYYFCLLLQKFYVKRLSFVERNSSRNSSRIPLRFSAESPQKYFFLRTTLKKFYRKLFFARLFLEIFYNVFQIPTETLLKLH